VRLKNAYYDYGSLAQIDLSAWIPEAF